MTVPTIERTRALTRTTLAAAVLATAAAFAMHPSAVHAAESAPSGGGYDGAWSGQAVTQIGGGRCGQTWKLEATVSGGEMTGTASRGGERYDLNGTIKADGTLRWSVFGAGANASGRGRIDGDTASGGWNDERNENCDGDFELTRVR